jgi:hypothetical protein
VFSAFRASALFNQKAEVGTKLAEEEADSSGGEAKPLPAAKADLGLLFDFQHGKKSSMYHSGYVSGFFPH